MECIRYSKYFLVYHPHLALEVTPHLHERIYDKDEKVRLESVKVVSEAAADCLKSVPQTVSWSYLLFCCCLLLTLLCVCVSVDDRSSGEDER